jgi:hypothetical protein
MADSYLIYNKAIIFMQKKYNKKHITDMRKKLLQFKRDGLTDLLYGRI